jgi:hypothetical protein
MDQKKKMAAAIAAVTAYIKSEEEAFCLQAAAPDSGAATAPSAPAGPTNLWGISGRQTLMQMGNMMQLKAFHRP